MNIKAWYMKNVRILLISALLGAFMIPSFTSCKKGDGDPFFSLNSRKARLTGEWKVSDISETVKYGKTTITTTFDGEKKKVVTLIRDTTVYTPTDTLYEYKNVATYTGSLLYSFDKSGTYQVDEAFINDTTGIQYTSQETGLWFFTGGGKDSDTKSKELLGLQATKYVYNPLNPDTYTLTYSGESNMKILHIYKLSTKEIVFNYDVEETANLSKTTTSMKMTLKPR